MSDITSIEEYIDNVNELLKQYPQFKDLINTFFILYKQGEFRNCNGLIVSEEYVVQAECNFASYVFTNKVIELFESCFIKGIINRNRRMC